ncbi:hypothetical protein PENANT_c026G08028 [Penicillium antarcticum]|uniref:Uncharacterized protein n=1 Tax=Penicillium antarcticum TaxID=416450 RepID=A0A1V6PX76_9EURO|nr:uncharacterized protein N7508_000061 [Penicillium antarcticum]KAJ5319778.1 hypothetical protein N7508_000061 [Penicillium antarcticum]OQD81638.1 hypothetical protein PENANT_c026G08028 [Penicillium antarcticum]
MSTLPTIPTLGTKECASTRTSPPLPSAIPPSYNDVSGAVVIGANGQPHFLSAEEEVERRLRLEQAVREKMLGLQQTTTFEWSQGPSTEQLPAYTPREEGKK